LKWLLLTVSNLLSKTDNKILWLLKILLGLCLLAPFFISSSLLFPYTGAKSFAFRITIEIAAVFYFYLALKYPAFRPRKNLLTISILVFFLTLFISSIFGVNSYLSFWGNLERMLGVWGIAHFILFFLMLSAIFKNESSWLNLLRISIGASTIISIFAIIQKFTNIGLLIPQQGRVFSTVGNSAFLAAYLVFNIFFLIYLLLRATQSPASGWAAWQSRSKASVDRKIAWPFHQGGVVRNDKRYWLLAVYCFLLSVNFLALFLTGTRGAFLGLLAGVIFCLLIYGFFGRARNALRYSLAVLFFIFLLAGLFFAFRASPLIKNSPLLNRIVSVSLSDPTVQNRLILWQTAWTAWQRKPLLGWGLENYDIATNKYFDARLNPYESWFDRAHNFVFDYGVMSGWLGLLGYLAMIGTAARYLKKIVRENSNNFVFPVLFGGLLTAYLIQDLFIFDGFVSYLMLFFLLALIGNWRFLSEAPAASGGRRDSEKAKNTDFVLGKKFLVAATVLVAFFSIYSLNIKSILASRTAIQVLSLPEQELASKEEPLTNRALASNTFGSEEIAYQITLDYLAKTSAYPQLVENEKFYKFMSGYLEGMIKKFPSQTKDRVALSWLNLYFSGFEKNRIDSAIALAQEVKALSPAKKDAYQILVMAYFLNGNDQKIKDEITSAEKISPVLGDEINDFLQSLDNY